MSDRYTHAKFWRCALQVNPAGYSGSYQGTDHGMDEAKYNQALLQKCLELNIKIIGVADHGSVSSIASMRQVLQPYEIFVFPGFEIASNDKIHYVCLFPEDTSEQQLERYLGNFDLLDPKDGVRPTSLSSEQVIEKSDELGGFIYAAHCTNDSGLLKERLSHVWKHPKLRAVQISGSIDDLATVDGGFYHRVLLNKEDSYQRKRPMVAINAKDVTTPNDLDQPRCSCFIKMTRPSFSAFKLAFLDPESRVRIDLQKNQDLNSKLVSLVVSGGYLDGLKAVFSDHLNTIIGGRGTGKSTLIECLRYALDIQPKGKQALRLHQDIIKENLGNAAGRVTLNMISASQNGRQYAISRKYGEPPIVRTSEGDVSTLLPHDLLPDIDIYSQNEVFELAQDRNNFAALLDRFLPSDRNYIEKKVEVSKKLSENQQKLTTSLSELDGLRRQVNTLPKLEEQLNGFEEFGIKEKMIKTPLIVRERGIAKIAFESLQSLQKIVAEFDANLPSLSFVKDESLEGLPDQTQLSDMCKILEALKQGFSNHLTGLYELFEQGKQQFDKKHLEWLQAIQIHEDELEKALRGLPSMAGKKGPELGVAYQQLLSQIERIKPMKPKLLSYEHTLEILYQERRNLLGELSELREQRILALQNAAKRFNKRLDGKLRVEIAPESDRTPLVDFLLKCNLESIGEKRLAWIESAKTISPLALVASIKNGSVDLQRQWEITPMVADALTRLQPSQLMALETLELECKINLFLNVAHIDSEPLFKHITNLSRGQQCTAILHILLLENRDPLIMDQPEDNLDNAFIAERIVTEIRNVKDSRQFLFATHNANIPVFGDAEWIGVFTATENRGSLELDAQGSIDVPSIRDQVTSILEGGRIAFNQRKEKYEF